MRNRIILVMSLLAVSFISKAQLYLGAKVGLNLANVSATLANTAFNKKVGINGGATLKYNFKNTLGVQMDVLYSQMGSKSKAVVSGDDGLGGTVTTVTEKEFAFSYLQIPLFVNLEIPIKSESLVPYDLRESMVSIHLYAGGYFGYGIGNSETIAVKSTTVDVDGNTIIDVTPKTNSLYKLFNPIDFGLAFGAGFSFKLSDLGRLTFDGRYIMGLANVHVDPAKGINPYPEMKNKGPQLQLGYIHRIGRLKRWQIL